MKALLLLPWWLHLPAFHSSPALQSSVLFSSSPCRHRLLPKVPVPAASEGKSVVSNKVVTISTWTVAVKDGLDSMNPRRIEFALEAIEPNPQSSCTIDDKVLSVNCLKKLSSEILFLYFHEKTS